MPSQARAGVAIYMDPSAEKSTTAPSLLRANHSASLYSLRLRRRKNWPATDASDSTAGRAVEQLGSSHQKKAWSGYNTLDVAPAPALLWATTMICRWHRTWSNQTHP